MSCRNRIGEGVGARPAACSKESQRTGAETNLKGVITRLGFVTWADAVTGVGHSRRLWCSVLSI
jgi:hypothetical protein